MFNALFNSISVILRRPVQVSMLSCEFFLTITPHNILSKPLAAFLQNHWTTDSGERGMNDYHQSSERKLVEPGIEPATSCSQVLNASDWGMWLSRIRNKTRDCVIKSIMHYFQVDVWQLWAIVWQKGASRISLGEWKTKRCKTRQAEAIWVLIFKNLEREVVSKSRADVMLTYQRPARPPHKERHD